MHRGKAVAAAATDDLNSISMQEVFKTPDTSLVIPNLSFLTPVTSQVDTSQVSAPLTPTPRTNDSWDSNCSERSASASQRQLRARGHHSVHHAVSQRLALLSRSLDSDDMDTLSPKEPFAATPGADCDRYDLEADLDRTYLECAKADSAPIGRSDDDTDSCTDSDFELGGGSEEMSTGVSSRPSIRTMNSYVFPSSRPSLRTMNSLDLVDSLLDFSYDDLASHVEAISPRGSPS